MKKTIFLILCILCLPLLVNATLEVHNVNLSLSGSVDSNQYHGVRITMKSVGGFLYNVTMNGGGTTPNRAVVYSINRSLMANVGNSGLTFYFSNPKLFLEPNKEYLILFDKTGSTYTLAYSTSGASFYPQQGSLLTINSGYSLASGENWASGDTYNRTDLIMTLKTIQIEYTSTPSNPPLTVVFNEQVHPDLNSGNTFATNTNISYNISNAPVNLTSGLFFKANNTQSNIYYCVNTTTCVTDFISEDYTYASSNTYTWQLHDSDILSGSYLTSFINYNVKHNISLLSGNNDYYRCNFTNIPNINPKFLEIDIVPNIDNVIEIGYMNYGSNTKFPFFSSLPLINHSHFSNKSVHAVISLPSTNLNNTWLYVRKVSGSTAYVRNIEQSVTNNLCQFSNNGLIWSDTNKILDMHIHWNSTLYYYANITDSYSQNTVSSLRTDLLEIGGLNPTSAIITVTDRNENQTTNNVSITKGTSPNDYAVTFYNLSLYNASNNILLQVNQTINFTLFYYDELTYNNSYYIIGLNCDELNQCSNDISNTFTYINYSQPIIIPTPQSTGNGTVVNVNVDTAIIAASIDKIYLSILMIINLCVFGIASIMVFSKKNGTMPKILFFISIVISFIGWLSITGFTQYIFVMLFVFEIIGLMSSLSGDEYTE
jgi:hypothetical protein